MSFVNGVCQQTKRNELTSLGFHIHNDQWQKQEVVCDAATLQVLKYLKQKLSSGSVAVYLNKEAYQCLQEGALLLHSDGQKPCKDKDKI